MVFTYVTGRGTDSTEQGSRRWARVKGKTENDLLKLPFKAAYMFRPNGIQPLHGVRSKTGWINAVYAVSAPLLSYLVRATPGIMTTSEKLGRAMIKVARDGFPRPILESEDINASRPSFRGSPKGLNLRCAIAHRGISGSRVRCCASPRNDMPTHQIAANFKAFAIRGPFALYFVHSKKQDLAWIAFASSAAASSMARFRFRARRMPHCH